MYSILIIFLFVFLALIFAGIAIYYAYFSDRKKLSEEMVDTSFQNSRFTISQNYLGQACIFLVFVSQILLLMPFAVAFNRLKFFVFMEVGVFLFFMLLCLWYSLQKNMLRSKE